MILRIIFATFVILITTEVVNISQRIFWWYWPTYLGQLHTKYHISDGLVDITTSPTDDTYKWNN